MFIRASLFRAVALALAVCVPATLATFGAQAAGPERVPINAQGEAIGERLASPGLSHDGRYLVFQGADDGLVPGDDNGVVDVFVYDYETGELVRASGGFLATFGAGDSVHPAISADGRFIAFASDSNALNLPIGIGQTTDVIDANQARDIFVFDRESGQTTAVSVGTDGALLDAASDYPSISGDGRFVVFQSKADAGGGLGGVWRIFAHDRVVGETRVISVDSSGRIAGLDSERPVISDEGRYVAFESDAALVGADTNGRRDIYRYDLHEDVVELVSVSSAGVVGTASSRGASISSDGSMIAFESAAGNLVDGDTNLSPDIFVRDLNVRSTSRVSIGSDGEQADGSSARASITADGSVVVFESYGLNIAAQSKPRKPEDGDQSANRSSVYLHSLLQGRTTMIAEELARSAETRDGDPVVSGDGSTMAFNELPLFDVPGGTIGGVGLGAIYRVGVCSDVPDFGVQQIFVNGMPQNITLTPDNVFIDVVPGDMLTIEMFADGDLDTCSPQLMEVFVSNAPDTSAFPDDMRSGIDTASPFDDVCTTGSSLVNGTLVGMEGSVGADMSVVLCWTVDAADAVNNGGGVQNGTYSLTFTARYPDSVLTSQVNITVQVLPCVDELGLFPDYLPPMNGFISGFAGRSQFDISGPMGIDVPDNVEDQLQDRNLTSQPDFPDDIWGLRLLPSEVAKVSIRIQTDCFGGGIEELFMPPEMFPQDPCVFGGSDFPEFPCFVTVLGVNLVYESNGMQGNAVAPSLPNPLTRSHFPMLGIPGDALLLAVVFELEIAPSALDTGNNLVSFQIRDTSNHISDPQFLFEVLPCFNTPCCLIDNYEIDGKAVPTAPVVGPGGAITCDGEDLLFPDFDGEIDIFPNQVLTFDVNGRMVPEPPFEGADEAFCFGGALQIIQTIDGGVVFPPDVLDCVPGSGYVCFGEVGSNEQGMQDVRTKVRFAPTMSHAGNSYTFRYRVLNSSGQSEECVVQVNVCPPPTCEINQDADADGVPDEDINGDRIPLAASGSIIVVAGEQLNFVVCGHQDCGEFEADAQNVIVGEGSRKVWVRPTPATSALLASLGFTTTSPPGAPLAGPVMGNDDPLVDANGDGDLQDPFEACIGYQWNVPADHPGGEFELCFQVYDPSVEVDINGDPVDPDDVKIVQCCITVTVCPPVTCETTNLVFNGVPAPPSFDPMVDTMTIAPGMHNVQFKVTAGGGCEEDVVQIDMIELIAISGGVEVPLPMCEIGDECCTFDAPCVFTDIFGAPVTFPFIADAQNMGMINVSCSFGADWYGLYDKIIIRSTVTADSGGPNEQTTTCDVMVDIGPCPTDPICIVKNEMPELCSLTGDPLDAAIVVAAGDPVAFDVNFMAECFGAEIQWGVAGLPAWLSPAPGDVQAGVFECSPFSVNFTGTPPMGAEGDYKIIFTVTDNTGKTSMCQVRIIVCDGPTCVITEDSPMSCEVTGDIEVVPGTLVTWDFSSTSDCLPGTEIMVDVAGMPAGATHNPISLPVGFTPAPINTRFEWMPGPGSVGVYVITYTTKDHCGREHTCTKTIRVCEPPKCEMTVLVNDTVVPYNPDDPLSFVPIKPGQSLQVTVCGMAGSSECDDLDHTLTLLSAPGSGPVMTFDPTLPITGPGMLCSTGTLTPGPLDVSPSKYVWQFGIVDSCDRVSTDLCELRVMVMPCDPPVCEIQDILVEGSPYTPGVSPPIIPGQMLTYTVKGTLNCAHDDITLNLNCNLPDGAIVTPGDQVVMDKVTMRTWDVAWTPLAGEYCNESMILLDCTISVTPPETVDGATSQCGFEVEVGECSAPECLIGPIMVDSGSGFVVATPVSSEGDCAEIYTVQPGDIVMFDVTGLPSCPEGAQNTLTIIQKSLPMGATMNPPLPLAGALDQSITATFMWTVTEEDCGTSPMAVFNISQTCGPDSSDCKVCFRVGDCEVPPTCELSDFMIQRNPELCLDPYADSDAEQPFEDLPVEMVDDGYKVYAMAGDTIRLTLCGDSVCTCTSLTLDAMGLPEDAVILCYDSATDSYITGEFPHTGGQNETPVCCIVEFVVPPTGTFHITFTVEDFEGMTAECVLWIEVEPVCNDFEPNDECELPQEILVSSLDPEVEACGPYLSGRLSERVTPGCQPDTFLVLFNKQNEVIRSNNNGSTVGNGKGSALFDITAANGLSDGDGTDLWLRIGVTGYPDGLVLPFNGFPQNGPHGQLGEFEMTVTFYDDMGEIISPAIVQDANGYDVVIDNPYVYTNEFITGAEAFRINFQAPRAFQGGAVTASASIEINNATGLDPLCDDVDFFKYIGLVPMMDYCITAVGGLSNDCTPIDLQLGWFDKNCVLMQLDADSGPGGVAMLCVVSDVNGEILIGVTGRGDDDFDGYLIPPPAPLLDGRAVDGCPDPSTDHGVCGNYTLCIMMIDSSTGGLVDRSLNDVAMEAMSQAMYRGDMNMDGKTDTSDLGLLLGRYGWSATGGVDSAKKAGSDGSGKTKAKAPPTPGVNAKLTGAMED